MYHEEQIINGVLHYRGTPNGPWIAYTAEQLTAKLTSLKEWINNKYDTKGES